MGEKAFDTKFICNDNGRLQHTNASPQGIVYKILDLYLMQTPQLRMLIILSYITYVVSRLLL